MTNENRITVCVNTKDRPSYLGIMLSSLLNQTYQNFDLILMDASKEPVINREEIARLLGTFKKYGHGVRYETDQSIGIPWSYQKMMDMAETEFIVRQEDDVWCEAEMLQMAMQVMEMEGGDKIGAVGFMTPNYTFNAPAIEPPEVLQNGFQKNENAPTAQGLPFIYEPVDEQGIVVKGDKLWSVCTIHGGSLYRKEAAEQVDGFCTHFSPIGHREETLFYTRMYMAGWALYVRSTARLWHYESSKGGSRPDGAKGEKRVQARLSDESKFQAELVALIKEHPDRPLYMVDG